MTTLPFTNFTKGEIAPELQARIDTNQYGAGAKKVRNFIIQRYGGLAFRPGFRLVAEVDNLAHRYRLIPFQFNIEQAYVLAMGDRSMRLLANGGVVLEDNLQITAITKAANAQLTVAFHAYAAGDRIYLNGITGMDELNNRLVRVVSVQDANNFTIDVDTRSYGEFISSTGTARTEAPPPPAPPPDPPPDPPPPSEPPSTSEPPGGNIGRLDRPPTGYNPWNPYEREK